jgi:hypothetical protein
VFFQKNKGRPVSPFVFQISRWNLYIAISNKGLQQAAARILLWQGIIVRKKFLNKKPENKLRYSAMFRITTLHLTVPPNKIKVPEIVATEESLTNASSKSGMPRFKAQETVTRPTTPPSDLAIILPTPVPNQSSHSAIISAARSEHIDIIPKQIEPNIFIGEGKAQSGEKFFLRMERVTNDNYGFWRRYLNATKSIVGGSRSLLEGLMQTTNAERDGNGNIQYINQHYEDCANYLDFDRAWGRGLSSRPRAQPKALRFT